MSDHGFTEPTKSGGMPFDEWMRRVDAWLYAKVGLHSDDLPDWGYRDAYDDDYRPSESAHDALVAAGYDGDEDDED